MPAPGTVDADLGDKLCEVNEAGILMRSNLRVSDMLYVTVSVEDSKSGVETELSLMYEARVVRRG